MITSSVRGRKETWGIEVKYQVFVIRQIALYGLVLGGWEVLDYQRDEIAQVLSLQKDHRIGSGIKGVSSTKDEAIRA